MRGDSCKRCVEFSKTGSRAGALLQKPNDLADRPFVAVLVLLILQSRCH